MIVARDSKHAPDAHEFCSKETGSWPHSALLYNIEKEN